MTAQQAVPVAEGNWGGQGLALTVTGSGAHLVFDCATGDISQALLADSQGRFTLDGVLLPGRPGPARDNEQPSRLPARYVGMVAGSRMTLNVTLVQTGQFMGSFAVVKDADATLRRCL